MDAEAVVRQGFGLILAAVAVALLGLAVLVVFWGRGGLFDRGLTATVALHDFALPADYSVDPLAISDALVAQMLQRTQSDVALRLMLEQDTADMLREIAIPRLVNAGVVRRIFDEMPGIGTVIAMPDYHALARVTLSNRGAADLADVALTLPGAIRAQGVEAAVHEGDIASVRLPALAAGETAQITVWLALSPTEIAARAGEIRVGSQAGGRGAVQLYAALTGWGGAELQVRPWARWMAAAFVTAAVALALAALVMRLGLALRGTRFLGG